jgi:glycerol-3-phosphate dehydrogenase
MDAEWALSADDVLWRRSKLGLQANADQRSAIERFMTGAANSPQ